MAATNEIIYNNNRIPTVFIDDVIVNFKSGSCIIIRDMTRFVKIYGVVGVIVQGLGVNYTFVSSVVDGSMSNFAIYVQCVNPLNLTANDIYLRLTYLLP